MTYKISFQLYSARFFPPLASQLPKLKAMGYDAVEPWMPALENPGEFRQQIDDAGLACSGFHAHFQDLVADPHKFVDLAEQIGANLIIPPWLAPEDRGQSGDDWKKVGDMLASAADMISAAGKRLAWHNHDFEFVPLSDGSVPIDHLFDTAGDKVGFEIDCAWIVRAGADPAAALEKYADRIWAIQPKDTAPAGTGAEGGWTAPGQGVIDWAALWPKMRQTQADHLVVEHDNPADWEKLAEDAINYLKKMDQSS